MARPVVLSASSVSAYRECGYRWFLTYVECRPERSSIPQVIGTAVHAGAETLLLAKMAGETPDLGAAQAHAAAVYAAEADALAGQTDTGASVERCVALYAESVLPLVEPRHVEVSFQFEVNGIPYSGIADVFDGGVRDTKTTKSRPSSGDRYATGMVGYALGYRELTGEIEAHVTLDYLVRTQTPYYWPITRGTISEEEIDMFAATVEGVAEGIAAEVYEPNGLGTAACNWCGHRDTCEYRRALADVTQGGNNA